MGNVNISQVAEVANVSKATVSYYLNGNFEKMSLATRKKLDKVVHDLEYIPSLGAQSLSRRRKSMTIGVVLEQTYVFSSYSMDFFMNMVKYIGRVIVDAAKQIRDNSLRSTTLAILENPAPTIAKGNEKEILSRLQKENLIDPARNEVFPPIKNPQQSPQPFWSAPGSGYASHHAYPGGLVTHTALNVVSAQALVKNYMSVNGLSLDYDAAVGGEILHDLHKPWVFAWQDDHSCRKEQQLASTGEHHVLSIAESIARKVPAQVIVAQACAHEHPATPAGEKLVVGWIKAASIIAGVDPIEAGLLDKSGKTLPLPRRIEGWVVHLADHDFVISTSACRWTAEALVKLAKENYGLTDAQQLNSFRNYVMANLTAMRLYGILSSQGEKAFAQEVARVVKK